MSAMFDLVRKDDDGDNWVSADGTREYLLHVMGLLESASLAVGRTVIHDTPNSILVEYDDGTWTQYAIREQ